MQLIEGWNTAMSAEYDMIHKMGIAHNVTKVSKIVKIRNSRQAMGSPPATMLHYALPAVLPHSLAALRIAGSTAGYSVVTLRVRRLLYSDTLQITPKRALGQLL